MEKYELRRAGKRQPLSRIPMEFLILLVMERGKLVTRERLAQQFWLNTNSVDVVQAINTTVARIRAALNDDATKPRFIETVVGKGYRFIAEVEDVNTDPGPLAEVEIFQQKPQEADAAVVLKENKRRHFANWPSLCALFLAIAMAGMYVYARHTWWSAATKFSFQQITTLIPENRATAAAISANGQFVAYANVDGIFVRSGNATVPLRAPSGFLTEKLAWFTDGTKLLASGFLSATSERQIWIVPVSIGPPRLLRPDAREGSPSPDGTRVAFVARNGSELWMMGANGGTPACIQASPEQDAFSAPFWSPDGRRVGYQRRHYAPERPAIVLMGDKDQFDINYERSYETVDVASRQITARMADTWMNSAAYLADGRILFLRWNPPGTRSLQLWEADTDLATGAFRGSPHLISNPVEGDQTYINSMSTSTDGRRIIVLRSSWQNAVFLGDFSSSSSPRVSKVRRLILDERVNFPHAWTRDSRAVIFESDRNGNFDLFKQDVDKRTPESIVATPQTEVWPQATPDGRWILYAARFVSAKQTELKLMRVAAGGGNPEEVPIGGWLDEFRCALGAGKPCVLRTSVRNQYYAFYNLDALAGKGRELARTKWVQEYVLDWDVSPNGTQIAIPNHDARSARIRVITSAQNSAPSSEREVNIAGLTNLSGLVWSADGKGWFVSVDTPIGNRLFYVSLDGRSRSLGDIAGWAVPSPDGRRVAFLNRSIATNAWMIQR